MYILLLGLYGYICRIMYMYIKPLSNIIHYTRFFRATPLDQTSKFIYCNKNFFVLHGSLLHIYAEFEIRRYTNLNYSLKKGIKTG